MGKRKYMTLKEKIDVLSDPIAELQELRSNIFVEDKAGHVLTEREQRRIDKKLSEAQDILYRRKGQCMKDSAKSKKAK